MYNPHGFGSGFIFLFIALFYKIIRWIIRIFRGF
jgi:hypothetical protein